MLVSTVGKWKLLPWEIPNVSIEVRAVACLRARDGGLRTLSSSSHWLWAALVGCSCRALFLWGSVDSYWTQSPQWLEVHWSQTTLS